MKIFKFFNLLKKFSYIVFFIIFFDLIINFFLTNNIKQLIGTERSYSLYSKKFHHIFDKNVSTTGVWGKRKYQIFTDQNGLRVAKYNTYSSKKENIGFIGDSFVWGSGIDYNDHFISKLNDKKYNYLNLGYVSYSPSIYYKKLKYFIQNKKIKFKKVFLFIDHTDIQDEGIFYREDNKGNIVRAYNSDAENFVRNIKHTIKNYLKVNSFIFKFYEFLYSSRQGSSQLLNNCIKNDNLTFYKKYLDQDRNNYTISRELQSEDWVIKGKKKTENYLSKINSLAKQNKIEIILVLYPSANEILNNITEENSFHTNFLKKILSNLNSKNITILNLHNFFEKDKDPLKNYKNFFISCDIHWNEKGHEIVAKGIKSIK